MEETGSIRMTALDDAVADNNLQMMKAAIPYINVTEQRFIAIYAKVQELMNTITFFEETKGDDVSACSLESESKDPLNMLNDMKIYASEQTRDSIDMMINMLNAFELYNTYKETMAESEASGEETDPMSMLKAFLPPEQQGMFDTYSMMLNSMQ